MTTENAAWYVNREILRRENPVLTKEEQRREKEIEHEIRISGSEEEYQSDLAKLSDRTDSGEVKPTTEELAIGHEEKYGHSIDRTSNPALWWCRKCEQEFHIQVKPRVEDAYRTDFSRFPRTRGEERVEGATHE